MCGRFYLFSTGAAVADLFDLAGPVEVAPRFNIAPSQPVAVVRLGEHGRELVPLRWGLIPSWAKDAKFAPINARSETAADKPTFRHAMRKRRCLIPSDGFYEWMRQGKAKQPFCFRLLDDKPFAFAGLWDCWEGPSGPVKTVCILTTEANELVRPAHDRMPVMLERSYFDQWLDPAEQNAAALAWMLRPYRAEAMRAYPVSPVVNSPKNDDTRCLEPAAANTATPLTL
jgi:putative SOS response-associated peptidase YedK